MTVQKLLRCYQLPPGPQNTFERRAIERFKKSLFQCGSTPVDLKMELNQVTYAHVHLTTLCVFDDSMLKAGLCHTITYLGHTTLC